MIGLFIVTGLIVLLGVLVTGLGADSRDGQDWRRHRPARPARAEAPARVLHALARAWGVRERASETSLHSLRPWTRDRLRWRDDGDGPRLEGQVLPDWQPPDLLDGSAWLWPDPRW